VEADVAGVTFEQIDEQQPEEATAVSVSHPSAVPELAPGTTRRQERDELAGHHRASELTNLNNR
jgi:hypothetical protein